MGIALSRHDIERLCGRTALQRGEAYYRSGRVVNLAYNTGQRRYVARVQGTRPYTVHIVPNSEGGLDTARCDCPAYDSYADYCKHIAAVLLQLQYEQDTSRSPAPVPAHTGGAVRFVDSPAESIVSKQKLDLSRRILSLFDGADQTVVAAHGTQPLVVEYIISASTHHSGRENLFMIEVRMGLKRTYIVPKIRELLNHLETGEPFTVSKGFSYDPTEHTLRDNDRAVIQSLSEIHKLERTYRSLVSPFGAGYFPNQDRVMMIPPSAWPDLLPLLQCTTVRLQAGTRTYDLVDVTTDRIPVSFALFPREEEYAFEVRGMEDIAVLESYGYAIARGRLHQAPPDQLRQLAGLQSILAQNRSNRMAFFSHQLPQFMERVLPSLRAMGTVEVAREVAEAFVQLPLCAKLYLDGDGDGIVGRLSYEYGDIMVDPMRHEMVYKDGAGRILIRDADIENRIMAILERSPLIYNGSSLSLTDDETVYRFASHTLPQLANLVEVLATSAAHSRMSMNSAAPRVTVDVATSTNWLEILFEIDDIDESEIRDILRSIIEKKTYHRLRDGAMISLEAEEYQNIADALFAMDVGKTDISGRRLTVPMSKGLHFLLDRDHSQAIRMSKSVRRLIEDLQNPNSLDFPIPATLKPVLRDYQKFGYQWLKALAQYGFGGILADDMGLGKTLQSIAFILSEQAAIRETGKPVLIVSPASLVYNWKNELRRFSPELDAVVVDGSKEERDAMCRESTSDVLITSYPLLRRDVDVFVGRHFHTLILDEAQAIKNHATLTAQSVRRIKADHCFGLTGTPMENSLDDLWSILNTTSPMLFPQRAALTELEPDIVARRIRPFLLRRLKADVLRELPEKIETTQHSELLQEQKKLYMAYLARIREDAVTQLRTEGFHKSRIKILAGLTRLRQLCCHPSLFVENYEGTSGKLEQLMELIDESLASGRRILIFSQFTSMLKIIRTELARANLTAFYLDGETPGEERVELCRRFNTGEQKLFLISLKAGGTGLNLIGADTVILYDLWWNPAVEQQAADRAHRIGQKSVVQVIRLITQGTIEEKMYELQQRKRDLIDQVLQPEEGALPSLTEEDIREILMI